MATTNLDTARQRLTDDNYIAACRATLDRDGDNSSFAVTMLLQAPDDQG